MSNIIMTVLFSLSILSIGLWLGAVLSLTSIVAKHYVNKMKTKKNRLKAFRLIIGLFVRLIIVICGSMWIIKESSASIVEPSRIFGSLYINNVIAYNLVWVLAIVIVLFLIYGIGCGVSIFIESERLARNVRNKQYK